MNLRFRAPLVAATLCLTSIAAHATLLLPADQTQLETWLGSGPWQFTQIFRSVHGDGQTGQELHTAVDGMGPTFTLASVTRGDHTYLVGGYDPLSWNSSGDYNLKPPFGTAPGTAFIFNLTTDVIQNENNTASGYYQTLNVAPMGPVFGLSFDLALGNDYAGNASADLLDIGSTFAASYGNSNIDILGNANLRGTYDPFVINVLEVYTFGPATSSVPDGGSTAAMLGLAILGLTPFCRRRNPAS